LLTHEWENVKLSANGQFTVPADARRSLGDSFYITLSLSADECLVCRSAEDLERDVRRLEKRKINPRVLTRNAKLVSCDPQGRVTIPAAMREARRLGAAISIVGTGSSIELWNPEALARHDGDETSYEALARIGETLRDIALGELD
jgi:DNA-binding transcriptional regulator/RsmH inhibitor MraZ